MAKTKAAPVVRDHTPQKTPYRAPLVAVTFLFFIWGFLTALNDILIPHLKAVFDLSYTQAMLIQFAFFGAYFIMSVPSGRIVARFGYQQGIVLGLLTAGCGALLFYPSASAPSYPLFLVALFVLAAGITLLQVAANPYVSVLGKPETASSRLTLTQAFNSLGTTLAPYLGGLFILKAGLRASDVMPSLSPELLQAFRLQEAASVKMPYLALAAALIGFAAVMAFLKLPVIASAEGHGHKPAGLFAALRHPHVVLGGLAIFCYVGAEVSISSFLINFLGQPDIAGLDATAAARFVAYYWGGAMVGRFIGSALLQRIEAGKLLGLFAAIAGGLVVTTSLTDGMVAMWAIVSIGLFNSIMFPTIFTLGISGLGHLTSQGASILVMSIIGGAIIPLVSGALADRYGIQMALLLSAACYLYILYYGMAGSRSA
ncbi:sugar MFS transporter [Methylotetracoccus oryzae]|uniref:sugar MFS transporter n=1 Tax=Methylotetracoccus oryzae TaxID=1919059 RepID=UPI0011183AD0|nr:sugar MFS transporter [Methylotetracoccus oryzae]